MSHIVITGCTRGLGRALVDAFIAAGHTVSGCGRSGDVIFDLRFTHPGRHGFDVVDVTQATRVDLWSERVLGAHGAPDLLINNAALVNTPAPLWKVPAAEFDRILAANVSGMANVIRAFVPAMVARGTGVVVNFSSGWGRSVSAGMAPYCATKWAVEGLTRALAADLPAGMAAVPFDPGVIDTAMLRQCWPDGAAGHPTPAAWAVTAAPFLLALGPADNGRPLAAP